MRRLIPEKLNAENFAAYGDVIEVHGQSPSIAINQGNTLRYNDLANIDVNEGGGKPQVNIFRSTPLPLPIVLTTMERHPLSSQTFIPLGGQPYLVVVAAAGQFNSSAIRVFLAASHQGINYRRGTWHHYNLALNQTGDFLVIDRDGMGENYDSITIEGSLQIVLTP